MENKLKGKLLTEPVSKEVEAYVRQCIDLVWNMCIQQPPMEIMWADLSQFVYLVEPLWFSPSSIGDLSNLSFLLSPFGHLYRREKTKGAQQDRQIG